MPRASRASNPPAAAAAAGAGAAKNVSSNAGRSTPSCSAPAYQSFRPVTRSMTRAPAPIAASPDLKEGGSASTSSRRSISDASFSIQSAASRPTVTNSRTPHKVTSSGWKPLTQPVALSEERKCANLTTAKRSRVASSRAVKDSTNHPASKANLNVPIGKKYRDEENMSQGDQLDGAVMPSPPKKLQTCKDPSDSPSIRKSTIRILGGQSATPLPTGKSVAETVKNLASIPAKVVAASTNDIGQSVPLLAQQQQPDTAKNSSVITQTIANERSQVNQLAATVVTLPRQNLLSDYGKKLSNVPIVPNQVSGLAGATAPLVTRKLEIGKVQNTSSLLSNPAYARALVIKQQERLLQQYKLGSSQHQQQQQQHQLYIKGPALFETDEAPPVEPLGTRCQLCKLDVAFRPQGDAGRDANAPPVVAVLACHHAFHSRCIESIYGLAEPTECLACVETGAVH
ncbi:hypothetical protein PAHAL_1G429000 [Panicum hallii]|uniref:RING-type domain-containing protein n=1 Tax=Panicum hallii TaxID=206008 RepID=A0A2S3GUC1_9POAL|nr:putative GPI-anchored protein pfl2 [Panicum hallii]PAN08678.1 hypothetical protein PAHAL_1G429000 [Panicum hallii]